MSEIQSPYRRGMQTSSGSLDFEGFTDRVNEMLTEAWGDDWGRFYLSEPTGNDPDKIVVPVITYDTERRIPSDSHKSIDGRVFDKVRDPDHPEHFLEVSRQWFDIVINFWVYHKTNNDARKLMNEFEDFLFEYKDYFKDLGISDIRFESEEPPKVVTASGQTIPQRNLRYLFRLERTRTKRIGSNKAIETVVRGRDKSKLESTQDNSLIRAYGEQSRISTNE